jgi:hypothetical protein
MKIFRRLLILSVVFCSGCIPYHFTTRQGAKGTVVDAQSGSPLPNVHVILSSVHGRWNSTNNISVFYTNQFASTVTTTNGTFCIPSQKQWGLLFILGDYFHEHCELKIESTNYQTVKLPLDYRVEENFMRANGNFGVINLHPIQ